MHLKELRSIHVVSESLEKQVSIWKNVYEHPLKLEKQAKYHSKTEKMLMHMLLCY